MPSYRSEGTIVEALEALRDQIEDDFEAIVVDSSPTDAVQRTVRARFPEVRFERSPQRLPPHAARNRGAALARGQLIVFTDPDCRGRPGWLSGLRAAGARGHAIVGGAVEPRDAGWLAYGVHACKFGPWMAGGPPGSRSLLPTANLALTRAAWERVGPFRQLGWSGDAEFCMRARATGFELAFEPSAVVEHEEEAAFGAFWRERVGRGRAFGALRGRAGTWSRRRALVHAAAAPGVPLLLLARTIRDARTARRALRTIPSAPILLGGYAAWAFGEAQAHLRRALSRPPAS